MSMSLTHAQAELLRFIERFQAENNGVSPSFEEMKQAVGLQSKSGVHRLIEALEERGRITRQHNRARAIEILDQPMERPALMGFSSRELVAELARRGTVKREVLRAA
jgi:repressor LexA